MKYILLFLLSITCNLIIAQSGTNSNSITVKTSFNGRHCRGTHGLCSFNQTSRAINTNSTIIYDEVSNRIIIEINRAKISVNEHLQILRENPQNLTNGTQTYYLMEDDFIIPNSIAEQLQIFRKNVIITDGIYPLLITENTITITFNLE